MENSRSFNILKKCATTSTSLQNFVEGIQKNVKEGEKISENNSKQKEVYLVGEIIDISNLEMCSVDRTIFENVNDPGVEGGIEEVGIEAEMVSEINAQIEAEMNEAVEGESEMAEMNCEIEAELNAGTEINAEVTITSRIEADIGDEQNTQNVEKVLTRKRARNTENWARKVNKLKRNLGECYKSEATGRVFPARSVKPGCTSSCTHKCIIKFTSGQREDILKKYWNLGDVSRQREFINNCVNEIQPKYRYARESSERKKNLSFHFLQEGVLTRVCKTFFCHTLDISAKAIETARCKFQDNITQPDLRGKHGNQPSLSLEIQEGIKRHINSFERIESHYLRQQTKREYIDGSLNISSMYRMYKEKCISDGVEYAKQHAYEKLFNYNFNIGFFQPKKDQCIQCFQFDNSTEEQKAALQEVHTKHVTEKELSRIQKENDKRISEANKNTKVVCMDLQAVIPVPCGDVSSFFYKRRLLCFNFTIFELVSNEGFCFLWHEGIAHRGSDEIGASLNIYLRTFTKDIEHLVIWSDNCFGQNKSKYMLSLLMQLLQIHNVKSITQKFLVVGHTQNEGDNMHSIIEKNKARCLKSGPIFTCDQIVPIIQLAKKSKPLYKVHQLQTSEVYDLKDLCAKTGKNFQKNDNGEKVVWTDIKVLMVEKEFPNVVKYKTSFADATYKSFKVRVCNESKLIELKPAYPNGPPKIPAAKKKDLMEICKQNSITACHHQFFNNLQSEETEGSKPAATKRRRAGA